MSDLLRVVARRQDGTPMTDNAANGALNAFRSALPTGSVVLSWGLSDGAFEATASVTEGTTQAQFQAFARGLMPAGIVGSLSLADDRDNPLYDAAIGAANVAGQTHPAPPPKASEWTVTRT